MTWRTAIPSVDLSTFEWEDSSENQDGSRLLSRLQIGTCFLHVEAYLAEEDAGEVQQFTGSFGDVAGEVYEAIGGGGAWQTVEIEGRDYILIITPYSG